MNWNQALALGCGVTLLGTVPVRAQDSYAQGRGKLALREMETLQDGYSQTYYFKISLGKRPFGYSEMTLTAQQDDDGKLYYYYRHDTRTKAPNGSRFDTVIEAKMTPQFSPIEIESVKTTTTKSGQEYVSGLKVVLGPKEVVQTQLRNERETTQVFDRPKGPFVYSTELALEHISADKFEVFDLAVFEPIRCEAVKLQFLTQKQPDMSYRIVAGTGKAAATNFYFLKDAEGHLTGWGQVPPSASSERIDREELDELLKLLEQL